MGLTISIAFVLRIWILFLQLFFVFISVHVSLSHSFHQMQFVVEPHLFLFYLHLYVFICICLCLGICLRQVRASTDAIHGGIRKAGPDLTLGAPRIKHSFCSFSSAYLYFHPCSFFIFVLLVVYIYLQRIWNLTVFLHLLGQLKVRSVSKPDLALVCIFPPRHRCGQVKCCIHSCTWTLQQLLCMIIYHFNSRCAPYQTVILPLLLVWPGPFNC